MTNISEGLENDLRIWWGNDEVSEPTEVVEKAPEIVVDVYGNGCS